MRRNSSFSAFGLPEIRCEEHEFLLSAELTIIGIEHVVVTVLDPLRKPAYCYSLGFTPKQLELFIKEQNHTLNLNHHLHRNLSGLFSYPFEHKFESSLDSEPFADESLPKNATRHTLRGFYPLADNYSLVIGTYIWQEPDHEQMVKLQHLWHYLTHWANSWVSCHIMSRQQKKLNTYPMDFNRKNINNRKGQRLTESEQAVLNLLVKGLDGPEIANLRQVSKETIRSQIKSLLHKTNCRHQNQLIAKYYCNQLDT